MPGSYKVYESQFKLILICKLGLKYFELYLQKKARFGIRKSSLGGGYADQKL
jgi:hypothetical protein